MSEEGGRRPNKNWVTAGLCGPLSVTRFYSFSRLLKFHSKNVVRFAVYHIMAPHHRPSDSSEDEGSDAPEAVSLSQSKKHIQKLETSRKNAEIAQRQSKREKNRERDRKLKERAEKNKDEAAVKSSAKGKGKVVESQTGDDELQARMERAMQEAQEESSEDEDEDEAESSSQFEESEGTSVNGEDEEDEDSSIEDHHAEEEDDDESESESEDESEDDSVHEEPPKSQKTRFNPDHLPDELFTAAFASKPKRKTLAENSEKDNDTTISRPAKKRKSSKIRKDVVIGYAILWNRLCINLMCSNFFFFFCSSRAIRMLPNSNQPSVPATLPSRKVKRFLDRTLALKGGKQRTKGWERRPGKLHHRLLPFKIAEYHDSEYWGVTSGWASCALRPECIVEVEKSNVYQCPYNTNARQAKPFHTILQKKLLRNLFATITSSTHVARPTETRSTPSKAASMKSDYPRLCA